MGKFDDIEAMFPSPDAAANSKPGDFSDIDAMFGGPLAKPKDDVGFFRSAGRGALGETASLSKTAGLALAAPVVIGEKIKNAITGSDDTSASDAAFGKLVDPAQKTMDDAAIDPTKEKQAILGKLGTAVGSLGPDLLAMFASGGEAAPEMLATKAPGVASYLTQAASHAFKSSRPIMIKAATEKAQQVLDAGGTPEDAVKSGATAAALTWAQNVLPMSMEGSLARRIATGMPVGMVQNEAGRVVQNAADPASLHQNFDLEHAGISGVINSVMSGVFGKGAAKPLETRDQLGYKGDETPPPPTEPQPQAVEQPPQGPKPSQELAQQAFAELSGDDGAQSQQQDMQSRIAISLAGMEPDERQQAIRTMAGDDPALAARLHDASQSEQLLAHGRNAELLNDQGTGRIDINHMIRDDAGLIKSEAVEPHSATQAADEVNAALDQQQGGYIPESPAQVQTQINFVKAGAKPAAVFDPAHLDHGVDLNGLEYGIATDPNTGHQQVVAARDQQTVQAAISRAHEVGLNQSMGEVLGHVEPQNTSNPREGLAVVQQRDPNTNHVVQEEVVSPENAANVNRIPGTDVHVTNAEQALAQRAQGQAPMAEPGSPFPGPAAAAEPATPGFHGAQDVSRPGAGAVAESAPTPRTQGLADRINKQYDLTGERAINPNSIHEVEPSPPMKKMAQAIKFATGTDVVYVHMPEGAIMRNNGETFAHLNGMAEGDRNTIYVNAENASPLNTMAHELTHVLEKQLPKVYQSLEDAVLSRMNGPRARQFKQALEQTMHLEGADRDAAIQALRRELVAEAVGEVGQNPKVWREVFADIGKDRKMGESFGKVFGELIAKVKSAMVRAGFIDGARDTEAVAKAFKTAYREWAAQSFKQEGKRSEAANEGNPEGALAAKIGDKEKPYTPTPEELSQHPNVERLHSELTMLRKQAERTLPEFQKKVEGIVSQFPGASIKIGKVKGMARAFAKAWSEYKGDEGDIQAAGRVKDLLRATIIVPDTHMIPDVIKAVEESMPGAKMKHNRYAAGSDQRPDGYRDALINTRIDGMLAEVQVNHPEMLAAKDRAHADYEEHDAIARKAHTEGRALTPEEAKRQDALIRKQRNEYQPAYFRADELSRKARETAARKADSVEGSPSSKAVLSDTKEPSEVRQEPPGETQTKRPSSSFKNLEPGGNLSGKEKEATSDSTAVSTVADALPEGEQRTLVKQDVKPVVELPVDKLKLSKDVPQFKEGADSKGITQKLHGKFNRALAAPIQVWERNNGTMEVISGRHRLDLAQSSGEKTIPAQVHREADGFTAEDARTLDVTLNVQDGRGKVKDYVAYFKELGHDREQARAEGLLNTAIGRTAFEIADAGSPEVVAAHANGAISDEAAAAVAREAPRDSRLQAVGLKYVGEGKPINFAVNMMRAVEARGGDHDTTGDMFGFDDRGLKEAEALAKAATRKQNEIRQQLSAIRGAAKRPELAKKGGVEVKDAAATQAKIADLERQLDTLDRWQTSPEVMGELRKDAGLDSQESIPFSRKWLERLDAGDQYLPPAHLMDDLPESLRGTELRKNAPLIMEARIARKLLTGKGGERSEMSHEDILGLPDLLRSSVVAVFKQAHGSVVALTNKIMDGDPLLIAIAPGEGSKNYVITDAMLRKSGKVNELKSAFPKNFGGVNEWLKNGDLLYFDPAKAEALQGDASIYRTRIAAAAAMSGGKVRGPKDAAPASRFSSSPIRKSGVGSEAQGPTKDIVPAKPDQVNTPAYPAKTERTMTLKKKPADDEGGVDFQRNATKATTVQEMLDRAKTGKLNFHIEDNLERGNFADAFVQAKNPAERTRLLQRIQDKLIGVAADALIPVKRWAESLPLDNNTKQRLIGDLYRSDTIRTALEKEVQDTFTRPMFESIDKAARAAKMTTDQVKTLAGDWMTARYAPKANKLLISKDRAALAEAQRKGDAAKIEEAKQNLADRLADVNGAVGASKKRGTGGGLNDAEAAQIKADIEAQIAPEHLEAIAKHVYDMMAWKKKMDIDTGRVSRSMVNSWPNHEDYVPLTGDPRAVADDSDLFDTGNHLNQGGEKAMAGRKDSLADNGIDAAFGSLVKSVNFKAVQDFKRSLMKAYSTSTNAGHDIGLEVGPASGLADRTSVIYRDTFKTPLGIEENRAYALRFKDGRIMEALMKHNQEQMNDWLKAVSWASRMYGRAVTQLTATFAPVNFVRDIWERSELLRTRKLYDADGKLVDVGKAARASIVDSLNPALWAASWSKAFKTGKASSVRNDLEEMLRLGGNSTWGDYVSRSAGELEKQLRTMSSMTGRASDALWKYPHAYSQFFEMLPSLAIYRGLKAQGMHAEDAAAATLDLMNFKKRGSAMGVARALYVFAQPNATSGYNLAQYLSTRTGQKRFAAQIALGSMLYAGLKALWGATSDDTDELGNKLDNLSNYTAERSIPVPVGGMVLKLPVGFGPPQIAWALAGILDRFASGRFSAKDALMESAMSWAKAIAPVSPSDLDVSARPVDWFIQSIIPTVLKPFFNIYADQTNMGGKLTPTYVDPNKLKSDQASRTTPQFYSDIAHQIHDMTGMDVFPDHIRALVDGYVVGTLHEPIQAWIDNPGKVTRGEPERMPIFAQIVDNVNDRSILNSIYFRVHKDIADANREYKADPENHEELRDMSLAFDRFQAQDKVISTMRGALKKQAPNMDPDDLADRSQAIEERADRMHESLLREYLSSVKQ